VTKGRLHRPISRPVDDQEAYDAAHFAFRAVRYRLLFDRWLREGDAALDVVSSAATADAIKRGAGRIEYYVLIAVSHPDRLDSAADEGAEAGDDARTWPRPPFGSGTCGVEAGAEVDVDVHA